MLSNCGMPDKNQKPGDQANLGKYNGGEEYGLIKWYKKPWLGILRYSGDKKDEVRKTISNVAIAAAKNNHIGYSQSARETYFKQLKAVKYNPSNIKVNCSADCSSSTAANVIAAGHLCSISKLKQVDKGMSSLSAVMELKKADFKYYTDNKYRKGESHLVVGDILVARGHLSIYVGDGKTQSVNNKSASVNKASFKSRHAKDGRPAKKGWYVVRGKNPFPINSESGGNCTWYAYGRFCEIANKWVKISGSGNAWTFYNKDRFPSCNRGQKPKLGAIACWGYGSKKGNPGHVAVVEEINDKGDIRITHDGWSGGWNCGFGKKDIWCKASDNYEIKGFSNKTVFRGFIYNPKTFDDSLGESINNIDESSTVDMRARIATLYSSNNYQYINTKNKYVVETGFTKLLNTVKNSITEIFKSSAQLITTPVNDESLGEKISDYVVELVSSSLDDLIAKNVNHDINSIFNISRYIVEAPFIKIKVGNTIIGSYKSNIDTFPNHIEGMSIIKTNGEINQYKINVVHQIRVGEDPNLLDKVFSTNKFQNIDITYGDTDTNQMFSDISAVITNINMNRDYSSAKITYSIEAVSTGHFITAYTMNFPAVTAKPSTIIRKLLYSSSISNEFKKAFPGMSSKTYVESKGLIPTNDKIINIEAKRNIDPISYINFLVSCMRNEKDLNNKILSNSSYFIFYKDDQKSGGYFEIREISKINASNKYNSIYEVTIGYPDNNNIFEFTVTNDRAWSLLYNRNISSNIAEEYYYTIENNGDINKYYSPSLFSSSRQLGIIDKNWWSYMVGFPVNATLTIRGLLRPAFLTNYIKINVVFYGQKHVSSGLYAITEQNDSLSTNGFRTTFSLVRIGED